MEVGVTDVRYLVMISRIFVMADIRSSIGLVNAIVHLLSHWRFHCKADGQVTSLRYLMS